MVNQPGLDSQQLERTSTASLCYNITGLEDKEINLWKYFLFYYL